ncbi:MAG TPA: hypothetical protein VGC66_14355 [Pyrinomonadaceae bacterium]
MGSPKLTTIPQRRGAGHATSLASRTVEPLDTASRLFVPEKFSRFSKLNYNGLEGELPIPTALNPVCAPSVDSHHLFDDKTTPGRSQKIPVDEGWAKVALGREPTTALKSRQIIRPTLGLTTSRAAR